MTKWINYFLIFLSLTFVIQSSEETNTYSPKLYEGIWPDFCSEHLRKFPEHCSVKNSHSISYCEELRESDSEFIVDKKIISQLSPYLNSIPVNMNKCSCFYCPQCSNQVIKGSFLKNCYEDEEDDLIIFEDEFIDGSDEEDDYHFEDYYVQPTSTVNIVCYKCKCLEIWYDKNNEDNSTYIELIYDQWEKCGQNSIPHGYFDINSKKSALFLEQHLKYIQENPTCKCYWPYRSKLACEISDTVYSKMSFLFENSYLSNLKNTTPPAFDFPNPKNPTNHDFLCNLFINSFFYSQYRQTFHLLANWEESNNPNTQESISTLNAIYAILPEIEPSFLTLYSQCLKMHPHPKIFYERGLVNFCCGETFDALDDISALMEKNHDDLPAEIFLNKGMIESEAGLYQDAILSLTQAINKDPKNKTAYFERAVAYFESGNFDQGLKDYLASEMRNSKQEKSTLSVDYLTGLAAGVKKGVQHGLGDMLPTWGPILGSGVWALSNSPILPVKVGTAVVSCVAIAGAYIAADQMVTEMRDLVTNWDKLSQKERGELSGYVIGKYGVDVFACAGSVKLMSAYRDLKKANSLLNFEIALTDESQRIALKAKYKGIEKHRKDKEYIQKVFGRRPYQEQEIRDNLQKMGYTIVSKPQGISDNFITRYSDKGCGIAYHDPIKPNYEVIRIMPGNPHSPNPCQQKPYIIHTRDGKALNAKGEFVSPRSPAAHVPVEEYVYLPLK